MATSPKRILSFVFVISYYIFAVIRPMAAASAVRRGGNIPLHFDFPAVQVLDAVLFGLFLVISLPLLMQLFAYNRTMRAADVDVLFPTPVSPKLVMSLRVLRDYLATLILPIFLLLITWLTNSRRAKFSGLFANMPHPETAAYLFKTTVLAWLLLAMVWTIYGYAATLFVNRSDLASERNLRVMKRAIFAMVVLTLGYIAVALRTDGVSFATALHLADSYALRGPYFMAHLATMFALGPLTGFWHTFVSGLGLLGLMGLGFAIALSEVGWMYDQAAVRGFETMESLKIRKSGDMGAILADAARRGRLKTGRQTWLHRLRVKPGAAMIWREAVVQLRTFRTSMAIFLIIAVVYSLLPVFVFRSTANSGGGQEAANAALKHIGWLFSACQGFGLFMYIMSTTATGYVELLRRVDLMKPLPFSPAHLMVTEVLAKTYLPIAMSLICTVIATVACPYMWPYAVAHVMYGPSLAVMLSSAVLVVTLLFPDIDDPTQRGFRGMMQLLAIALAIAPGLGLYIAIAVYGGGPILGGLFGMIVNLGVTVALTAAAGFLYLGFNPSE